MKTTLILVLLFGLILAADAAGKKNKKGKGDEGGNAEGTTGMDGLVDTDNQGDMDTDDMVREDTGMTDTDSETRKGSGGGGKSKHKKDKDAEMCEYTFTVPSTEQVCSAANAETKATLQQLSTTQQDQDRELATLRETVAAQDRKIANLESRIDNMMQPQNIKSSQMGGQSNAVEPSMPKVYRDCQHIAEEHPDGGVNGVYEIQPWNAPRPFKVYCYMDGYNSWNVIQKRRDGSLNFNMDWLSYKVGFGDLNHEYWVGNENLHKLTTQSKYMLRVVLTDWDSDTRIAEYDGFYVDNEYNHYRLYLGRYNGTAGDSMSYHDRQEFSTPDRDRDSSETTHCAKSYISGWWFNNCFHSNLNGLYHSNEREDPRGAVSWYTFRRDNMYSMKTVTMMVKRLGFV